VPSLTSNHVIDALETFRTKAGSIAKTIHSDFDKNLIGGKALKWTQSSNSKVIAAPTCRQSSHGLVEHTWCTIVTMAHVYIREKQVTCEYWYFAILHAANMINQISGRLDRTLTTRFEAIHNQKLDSKTWFELFSVGYFDHITDSAEKRSKTEDQM